jgi:hypothetical protein
VFFPIGRRFTKHTWSKAREYCARCDVRAECLAVAMRQQSSDDRWGMFGGLTPQERRALRRLS